MKNARSLACLVAAWQFGICVEVSANPVGPVVQAGGVGFQGGAGLLQINQTTPRAIINWQGFSIGRGEITRINQPNARAALLNRVVGINPSEIFGSLNANGRVYLINPNGILVGREGRITAGQFAGSTRDVADRQFLHGRGRLSFSGSSEAPIRNEGEIRAERGGVYLMARTIENAGTISAPRGTVGLAAGSEVLLQETGRPGLSVVAARRGSPAGASGGTGIDNSGLIEGVRAELVAAGGNIYSLAIANRGAIRATSLTRENGVLTLRAAGGNIQNSGSLTARNGDGSGGRIRVEAGHGADNQATVTSSGVIDARSDSAGQRGGSVQLTGDRVALVGAARVDVSGAAGGGTALIGGGYQGQNPAVQNARQTEVGRDAVIRADATERGHGGTVVLWADDSTSFAGSISARGGSQGGDGGRVETSGKIGLSLDGGRVDAGSPYGQGGRWLLDPSDITIDTSLAASIKLSLDSGTSVEVKTDATQSGSGDITVDAGISSPASATLTLSAHRDIQINKPIDLSAGNLTLTAGRNISQNLQGTLRVGGNTILTAGAGMDHFIKLDLAGNYFHNISVPSAQAVALRNDSPDITDLVGTWDVASLTLTMDGTLNQSGGRLTVGQASIINANGHDVTLESLENDFGGLVTINGGRDVKLVDRNDLTVAGKSASLDAWATGGNLKLAGYETTRDLNGKASADISQTAAVTAGGTTTLNAGQAVDLADANNDFGGAVTVTAGGAAALTDKNSLTVGGSSASLDAKAMTGDLMFAGYNTGRGNLAGKAGAAIGQSGALTVGATTLDAVGAIQLNRTDNDFQEDVTVVKGAATAITDMNSLTVGGGSASLNAEAMAGNLMLNGYNTSGGTLDGKASGDIKVQGAVTAGATTLNAVAGSISQTAAVTADGTTTLKAGGDVTLADGNNDFVGAVTVTAGGAAKLMDKNELTVGGSSASLNAEAMAGNLMLNGYNTSGGTLDGKASGDIKVQGAVTAGATTLNAVAGSISQTAAVTAGGTTTLNAGGGVTLQHGGNDFVGAVTVTAGGAAELMDKNELTVGGSSASLNAEAMAGNLMLNGYNTSGGTLDGKASGDIKVQGAVTAGATTLNAVAGSISQTAAVTADGTTTLKAGGDVTLADGNNDFKGAVTVGAGGSATLKGKNSMTGSLTVGGSSAGLDAEAMAGNLALAGYDTKAGDLKVTAMQGNISQTATVTAGGATTLAARDAVTLADGNNDFKGAVTVGAGGSATLKGKNSMTGSLTVGGSSAGLDAEAMAGNLALAGYDTKAGDLKVTAMQGNISQTATVTAGGATTLTARDAVTLADGNNDFKGAVTVGAGGSATLKGKNSMTGSLTVGGNSASLNAEAMAGNLALAGYSAGSGNLEVTALQGNITQTAPLTAAGNIIANGKSVTLVNADNKGNPVNEGKAAGSSAKGNPAGLFLKDSDSGNSFFISGDKSSTAQEILSQTTPAVVAPLADPGRVAVPDILPAIEPPRVGGVTTPGLQVYGERMKKEADKKAKGTIKLLR